jgi:hypothetical protein
MSFTRLATVEVQSCMHFLTSTSLALLARCSRFTLACANAEFAWRFAPLQSAVFRFNQPLELVSCSPGSLLRFCGLSVQWMHSDRLNSSHNWSAFWQAPAREAEVDALLNIPNIRAIIADERKLSVDTLAYMLGHPCFSRIRSLQLPWTCEVDAKCVDLLQLCGSLTLLRLDGRGCKLLQAVPQLPSLKDLAICDTAFDELDDRNLSFVHKCTSLRSLSLFQLRALSVHALLSSNISNLTSLSLSAIRNLNCDDYLKLWKECFAALSSLMILSLDRMGKLDLLLQSLTNQLPLLNRMSIAVQYLEPDPGSLPGLPSFHLLEAALSRPSLHLSISIRSFEAHQQWAAFENGSEMITASAHWRDAHQRLSELVERYPHSLTLVLRDE